MRQVPLLKRANNAIVPKTEIGPLSQIGNCLVVTIVKSHDEKVGTAPLDMGSQNKKTLKRASFLQAHAQATNETDLVLEHSQVFSMGEHTGARSAGRSGFCTAPYQKTALCTPLYCTAAALLLVHVIAEDNQALRSKGRFLSSLGPVIGPLADEARLWCSHSYKNPQHNPV